MFYRAVYGLKVIHKETRDLSVEHIDYGANKTYFEVGLKKTVTCKATSKNQKVDWVDPSGKVVQRASTNRVFAQEHFMPYLRNRIPALVLTFNHVAVSDTGLWECRSGDISKEISLCVIERSEFVDTPTEVTVELGRSITLTCQAKGEPEPRLSWYRNGELITDQNSDSKYRLTTKYNSQGFESLLTITGLESEDSGDYVCDAIQESNLLDDCTASTTFNITLHVKFAPKFADGNSISYVAGMENESVSLVCAAEGYPEPSYKWFIEVNDSEDSEYAKVDVTNDGKSAIINVVANASTFGQRYRCQASNQYGNVNKYFVVVKLEKPKKPSQVNVDNATHDSLYLSVKWDHELFFTVDEIFVQYMEMKSLMKKKVGIPREIDWQKAFENEIEIDQGIDVESDTPGLIVTLPNLEEETQYWIRIRATNAAGDSPWSEPILVSTIAKPEEIVTLEEDESDSDGEEEPDDAAQISDGTFYGIFFAGGILVVAVGCMFAMRLV
ncbi:unnamed protein product, partial [Brenthis ino]